MNPIPIHDETVPITCTATSEEIRVRIATIERMRTNIVSIERTEHGLLLHLLPGEEVADEVRQFTVDEQGCCRFWGFEVESTEGGTTLRWDGPPSVDELVCELARFFESDQPASAFDGLF